MPLEELWEPGAARRIPGRPTPEMPSVTSHLRVEWVERAVAIAAKHVAEYGGTSVSLFNRTAWS